MKKIISLTLAIVILILASGCSPDFQMTRGKIEGNVYLNETLFFKFNKPDSWVYSTDEEIAAAINVGIDALSKDFKGTVDANLTTYDMMAVDSVTRANLSVGYENLEKSMASNITVEQYINAMKEQSKQLTGITIFFPDNYDAAKLGKDYFTKLVCTTVMRGVEITQVYYLRKVDKYMATIIVTLPKDSYTIRELEEMFTW